MPKDKNPIEPEKTEETVETEKPVETEEIEETEETEKIEEIGEPEEMPAKAGGEAPVLSPEREEADHLRAELVALRAELSRVTAESARRAAEYRAGRLLRERSLPEELTAVLFAPEEGDVSDEVLLLRVTALQGAVEAAALRTLSERTERLTPGGDRPAAVTGRILRETPVAQLSQLFSTF